MTTIEDTREAWLGRAAVQLGTLILTDEEVPPMRISVGWAGGGSNPDKTAGQCWPTTAAADGVNQIFIAPSYDEQDTVHVLGTLLHEMIHAVDDCEDGHTGNFARIARGVGFLPKLTCSKYRTEGLNALLGEVAEIVGPFPNAAISRIGRAADVPKKQTSRMIKAECTEGTGYKVRLTQKWIDELGSPICPCHELPMDVEA